MEDFKWDRSHPFILGVVATADEVDGYGHVSTANYVSWMIDCAFAHSAAVGLDEAVCRDMARGMAAVKFDVKLLGSAYEGDPLAVATWIVRPDGKLRLSRQFQIVHRESGKTLARGDFDFVCTNLDNGRPVRLPPLFVDRYVEISEEQPG